MITQEEVKRLLHYDPETGVMTRKVRTSNRIKVGDVFGSPNSDGYLQGRLHSKLIAVHRLAFLYMTGEMPPKVDHKNRIVTDNRWENLRPASNSLNSRNSKLRSDNTSGCKGVYWFKRTKRWYAVVNKQYIGSFATIEEAVSARKVAEKVLRFDKPTG